MKEITLKIATKQEILDHYKTIVKGEDPWPVILKDTVPGDLWVKPHHTVEKQINEAIDNNTPYVNIIVSKILPKDNPDSYYNWDQVGEAYYISDFNTLKTDRMISEIDNDEVRNFKLNRLRDLLTMEENSKELYDKIVSAMKEFDGVTLKF